MLHLDHVIAPAQQHSTSWFGDVLLAAAAKHDSTPDPSPEIRQQFTTHLALV